MRARALTLINVIAECRANGPLHLHRVLAAVPLSWFYVSYLLPIISSWGVGRMSREVQAGVSQPRLGGFGAEVHWGVPVLLTLVYLWSIIFGVRFMERRTPVKRRVFEWMIVYNSMQTLLNFWLAASLCSESWKIGYRWPWGNAGEVGEVGHRLGMLIWFQYHFRQLDLFDTFFMILRKKFDRISVLHVYLRLLNMWGWFAACRFACGGDTYFQAVVHSVCQGVVYLYYVVHLISPKGVPCLRRARVVEVQVLQFLVCVIHSVFVLIYGDLPRAIVGLNLFVMANALVFYIDFDGYQPRLGPRDQLNSVDEGFGGNRLTFCFDSCGWLYCYHFGVAKYIQEHLIPEGLDAADAETDKFPRGLAFSGSSGGSLVGATLASCASVLDLFNYVLTKRDACRFKPWEMFPSVEDALTKLLPANAHRSLSGRMRVLLTRVTRKAPFVLGEAVDQFGSWNEAWRTLRASCHIPGIFLQPYQVCERFYFDGLMWSSLFVPWVGDHSDHVVRISALSRPLTDIHAPVQPLWWALFPPPVDVLRGLFWIGYQDAAQWFAEPQADLFDVCKGRDQTALKANTADISTRAQLAKFAAARKLLVRPASTKLPSQDPTTGQDVAELIEIYRQAVRRNLWGLAAALFTLVSLSAIAVTLLFW